MALAPPPATAQLPGLKPATLLLPWDLRLTPEQFERVCQANPEAMLELGADGSLIAMTSTGGETGSRNSRLLIQLGMALSRVQPSLRIFDSSTGFLLPDGSVLSPDAALVLEERWQDLSPEQRRSFPPLSPDLVIELASTSDEGPRGVAALRSKMDLYQANGARLGWLLLPHEQAVEIWRCGQLGMGERLENASRLDGSELAEGLGLNLEEIWVV
ncbi:MAG: Uma2 family endonuclease [Cyanobacteria bacterium]|nr:Uma2 family endonuclease [Cyanobacteriota bacterium]